MCCICGYPNGTVLFSESSHRSDSGSGYWQLQLDRDLVDTIAAIYPEWFKTNAMADGGSPPTTSRDSPPKAVVDTTPLLNTLEQNKECKCLLTFRFRGKHVVPSADVPSIFFFFERVQTFCCFRSPQS